MAIGKHGKSEVSNRGTGECLALVALAVYVVSELLFRYSVLPQTYPQIGELQVLAMCNSIVMACSIVAIATKRRPAAIWQAALVAVALVALLYSAMRTGDYRLVFGIVVVLALAGVDLRRVCAVFSAALAGIVIVMALLTLAGIISGPDGALTRELVVRVGFADHNAFGAVLFSGVAALGVVLWQKRLWSIPFALALVAAVFSYTLLGSRGAAIALVLLAIALLVGNVRVFSRMWDVPQKPFFVVLVAVPVFILLVLVGAVAFYGEGNAVTAALDKVMGGRIALAHDYYAVNGGYTHLGRPLAAGGDLIDSGYLYLLLVTGLLPMYALFVVYIAAAYRLAKTSRHFLVFALLVISAIYLAIDLSPLFVAESAAFLFLAAAFESGGEEDAGGGEDAVKVASQVDPEPDSVGDASKKHGKSDIVLYVLSGLLLVTLGAAAVYGWHYGNVDTSVAPGSFTLYERNDVTLEVDIDDDLNARVKYLDHEMTGKFVLAGAEEDSILFQLRSVEFADGADSSDAVFYLRMPRSGLQGDLVGPWVAYFSCPSQGLQHSDWVIAVDDGTAMAGSRDGLNAITAQRKQLVDWSSEWVWKKDGDYLWLIADVAAD